MQLQSNSRIMWAALIALFVLVLRMIEAGQININSSVINVPDYLQINQLDGTEVAPFNASHVAHSRSLSAATAVRRGRSLNAIDRCWRTDTKWARNRKRLANCALGFAAGTTGGKAGKFYVVTNAGDDAENPWPGTLRYGVIQERPLWIVFARDMTIVLQKELIFTSDKTLDGRGANVHIAYGACITLQYVRNVIIHGLNIHDCRAGSPGRVRSSTSHIGYRGGTNGDAITVFGSRRIWIDHNSFLSCADGLVDVIHASTAVTISNNYFAYHDKVMLFGHSDGYSADKIMRVTVAFNHFGPGLRQRMPRCRFGYCHVVNNDYDGWGEYAIGGSAGPTILSQGNRFKAPSRRKQVTKREGSQSSTKWNWRSIGDTFVNGAYFVESGGPINGWNRYGLSSTKFTPSMTSTCGALKCKKSSIC